MMAQTIKKGNETGNMGKAFMQANIVGDLGKACQEIGKAIGGPFGKAFANFAQITTTVFLAILCPMALLLDLMLGDATFIKQICIGLGMDKKTADKVAMAIQIAYQIVAAIILSVFTGGASVELMVVQTARTVGTGALEGVKAVQAVLQPSIDAFVKLLTKVFPALEDAGQGALSSVRAELEAFVKFAEEAFVVLSEGVINVEQLQIAVKEAGHAEQFAKAAAQTARQEGVQSTEQIAALDAKVTEASAEVAKQTKLLDTALGSVKEASQFSKRTITKAVTIAETVPSVIQGAVDMNNSIIRAQIARLKGEMEAIMILVEQFVKLLKDLVAKLMEAAKGVAQDIKHIGEQHQQMFNQASQTISNMFNGA